MSPHRTRSTLAVALAVASTPALAQNAVVIPEIVVTAPSPIQRSAPPAGAPTAPDVLQGTLPIITDQFATVTAVPLEEIRRTPGATLGDILGNKPGITSSSFAPGAASRPIVRGQDNYRVRIQENGLAVNDMSDIGEDHGVAIDPLAARQIEVLRGPATLRYGSQAIGGVVNVENNRIPTAIPFRGFGAEFNGAYSSVDRGREGSVLLDAGRGNVALHFDAYGRTSGDYSIPTYPYLFPEDPADPPVVNGRQPNSAVPHARGLSMGGSYLFSGGYIGAAVSQFGALYRVPGQEATETNTRIDMLQTKVTSKGEFRPSSSSIDAIRFWASASHYHHDELANEGFDGIQASFINKSEEGQVEVQFAPRDLRFASLTSAFGVQGSHQKLDAPGAEGGLFDPNTTETVAAYLFNEFRLSPTWRAQLSGRIEHANVTGSSPDFVVDPDTPVARDRDFAPKSIAAGLLHDLPWNMVGSLTAQYVERAPRAPELLSRGVHEATGTFDVGDPNLSIEKATSFEIGIRRSQGRFRFEATAFHTQFDGYIYRNLTGLVCDETYASCVPPGGPEEFAQAVYSQRDAKFRGIELQGQFDVAPLGSGMFGVDGQYDLVRATFDDGSNVPRIPPQRLGGGVYWRDANWFARVGLLHAFDQNDISANETTTEGYDLLKAELSYTKKLMPSAFGPTQLTLGISGNNLLDEDIRNAASFKKDEVLLPGRSVRVFASVKF